MGYNLQPGLDIVIHHKNNDEINTYYPFSKTSNIINSDGKNVDELLETKADIKHAVPDVEPTNELRYLRNDGTWATIPSASAVNKGVVKVSSVLTEISDDTAASTVLIDTIDKKIDSVKTSLNDYISNSEKGVANGVATLDENGVIVSSQLPSYIDDIVQGYVSDDSTKFYINQEKTQEVNLETGKIYYDIPSNKSYRYSGDLLVVIPDSIALGNTSSTAFRGDLGQIAYDHSQSQHARIDATNVEASATNGNIKINGSDVTVYSHPIKDGYTETNPHGTTKTDIGLEKVENLSGSEILNQYLTSDIMVGKLGYTPAKDALATATSNGLMSGADKAKMDTLTPIIISEENDKNDVVWLKTL